MGTWQMYWHILGPWVPMSHFYNCMWKRIPPCCPQWCTMSGLYSKQHPVLSDSSVWSQSWSSSHSDQFNFLKMVRKLKFHEQKLLRKVNFVNWEVSNNLHEVKIMRRYCIQKREDYTLYNKLSREIREIVRKIKDLDPASPHRVDMSAAFLEKLWNIGQSAAY